MQLLPPPLLEPAPVAKSSIILEVKPWDDETDVKEMERLVRGVEADGLRWGASKFVPVAYGIKKLQINCIVEDEKVGTDFLEESITAFEDIVSVSCLQVVHSQILWSISLLRFRV